VYDPVHPSALSDVGTALLYTVPFGAFVLDAERSVVTIEGISNDSVIVTGDPAGCSLNRFPPSSSARKYFLHNGDISLWFPAAALEREDCPF
jgi:hypothetical protein